MGQWEPSGSSADTVIDGNHVTDPTKIVRITGVTNADMSSCATTAGMSGQTTMSAQQLAPAAPVAESPAPAATPNLERAREEWQHCPECGFKRDAITGRHFQLSPTTRDCEHLYPLRGPGGDVEGQVGPSEGDGGNGAVGICQTGIGATTPVTLPVRGSRGPSGGIYAVCAGCRRVWERPRKKGRPGKICGDCAR